MRTAVLAKKAVSLMLTFSFSSALAAQDMKVEMRRRVSIDNEIKNMATTAKKNSQKRVQVTKTRNQKRNAKLTAKLTARATPVVVAENTDAKTKKIVTPKTVTPSATDLAAFAQFEKASDSVKPFPPTTTTTVAPTASTRAKLDEAKTDTTKKSIFSGSVGITVGKDSNASAEKAPIPEAPVNEGSFFELAPKVGFKGKLFSGNFGARMKDFTDQKLSDVAKETEINADLAIDYNLGVIAATTKVDFINSDIKWPDYISKTQRGMPLRYFQSRFTQSLKWDLGQLNLETSGSFANKDFTTPYMDNDVDHIFGQTLFERDQRIAEGKMRVGAKLADVFEIAVRPMIRHTQYTEEPARHTDGSKGGAYFDTSMPRAEIIKQEGNIDLILTTSRVNLTPTFTFGNDSDESTGALDSTYQGGGIKAELTVDPQTSLKLTGEFKYKRQEFDNWTIGITNPLTDKRKDTEKTTTVGAAVNLNKSFNIGVNYSFIKEISNLQSPDENYEQEIVGTTLTVMF